MTDKTAEQVEREVLRRIDALQGITKLPRTRCIGMIDAEYADEYKMRRAALEKAFCALEEKLSTRHTPEALAERVAELRETTPHREAWIDASARLITEYVADLARAVADQDRELAQLREVAKEAQALRLSYGFDGIAKPLWDKLRVAGYSVDIATLRAERRNCFPVDAITQRIPPAGPDSGGPLAELLATDMPIGDESTLAWAKRRAREDAGE